MSLRLQELHPSIVHFPIALVPLAVGAELLGAVTGRKFFRDFGRQAITLGAAGAAAAAVTGLIAGEEVNVEGRSRDMLMTHRNLNAGAVLLTTAMAIWRRTTERPGAGYIAAGLAGIGVLSYTAYLGGKLVYDHGVGVDPAKGVWRPDAPKLGEGRARAFWRDMASDLWHGVQHMGQELAQGKIVPALAGKRSSRTTIAPSTSAAESS